MDVDCTAGVFIVIVVATPCILTPAVVLLFIILPNGIGEIVAVVVEYGNDNLDDVVVAVIVEEGGNEGLGIIFLTLGGIVVIYVVGITFDVFAHNSLLRIFVGPRVAVAEVVVVVVADKEVKIPLACVVATILKGNLNLLEAAVALMEVLLPVSVDVFINGMGTILKVVFRF